MGRQLFSICLIIDVFYLLKLFKLLRQVKGPLRIALCKESCYNLINVSGPYSVILQPRIFHTVRFTDTRSADKIARKITKIFQSLSL